MNWLRLGALALGFAWSQVSHASLEEDGIWNAGVWATTVWADGVWQEGAAGTTFVPNVVGLSTVNADTALEAVSLDTGTVTDRCSGFADDTVLGQSPLAGAEVNIGTTVDLEASNGMACPSPGQRPGIRLPAISMPGL